MIDQDLRSRTRRLLSGDRRVDDLDRLYLGQRGARSRNKMAFLEIGDFVAHRNLRNKGLITQAGRDVFTSLDVWSMHLRGVSATRSDRVRAARSNLRLANDMQLKEAGCGSRTVASSRLDSAIAKFERGQPLGVRERTIFEYMGSRFIWRPAFEAHQLTREFADVLILNGLMDAIDRSKLESAEPFIALHALAIMHQSSITLGGGASARLYAGYANVDRRLEVKIQIVFRELAKPVIAPVCLFLTDLMPEGHCDSSLIGPSDPVLPDHWSGPIEVTPAGILAPFSNEYQAQTSYSTRT
jgi:hypothetical protein